MTSEPHPPVAPIQHLADGGRLGALMRAHDWSASPLGPPTGWPQSLRSAVSMLLPSRAQIVLFWGPDFIALYNDAYAPTIGNKHPNALGRPAREHWTELWDDLGPLLTGVLTTGKPYWAKDRPFRIERHGFSEEVFFDVSYDPIRGETGEVEGVFCIVSEMTEKVLAERRLNFLLELGDRLRTLAEPREIIEAAAASLGGALGAGRCGYAEIGENGTTFTVERDWTDGIMPSLAGAHRLDDFGSEVVESFRAGQVVRIADVADDARIVDPSVVAAYERIGAMRSGIAVPLIKDGRFVAALYVHSTQARPWPSYEEMLVREVAERTWEALGRATSEAALRESEARFRGLADVAPVLIWVAGPDGRATWFNKRWLAFSGRTLEAELALEWPDRLHPDDVDESMRLYDEAIRQCSAYATEYRTLRRDGEYRWLYDEAVPRFGADGVFLGHMGSCIDITERKQAEIELERRVAERTKELAAANRQLKTQIEEREKVEATLRQMQRLEAVGQLTSGVAHDFNNLLTVVLGNMQLLRRQLSVGPADAKLLQRLDRMEAAAERGAKLTGQLLAFSRRQRLEPKAVDLNETVTGMRDLLVSTLGGATRLETRLAADLQPALVDPTQIELVLLNLAINARDAMLVGGNLTISTWHETVSRSPPRPEEPAPGRYAVLSVADTGSGMTAEVRARIFEPFFTTKDIGKGSGLGLAQVYGFAKQSGGGIAVDTRLGEGTEVKVYLPVAKAQTVKRRAAARSAEAAAVPGGHRILLVDDDPAVREVAANVLTDRGYVVTEVGSGGAALDVLDREGDDIDLLLVDFAMPGMNGSDVARQARSSRPNMPILFVTGYADLAAIKDFGKDDIIQKPFRDEELARKVRVALLERS